MGAIYGVWNRNGALVSEGDLSTLRSVLETHWAADDRAEVRHGPVGLGQLNLAVTPESIFESGPAAQARPSRILVTADAWLDNREELCECLAIPLPERSSLPDSQLILQSYERWGENCAERLRGDFAFAIWNGLEQSWYCARDLTGSRPFFFFDDPVRFVFASDLRCLLAFPEIPKQLDEVLLAARLVQRVDFAELNRTYFQGIRKLPPSHFLKAGPNGIRLVRYWNPLDVPEVRRPNRSAYVEEARHCLETAVKRCMRTSVRIGAHLSGGLDSTAVAVMAARQRGAGTAAEPPLIGYSWSPPPGPGKEVPSDERQVIHAVASAEEIPVRFADYGPTEVVDFYRKDFTTCPTESVLRESCIQELAARDGVRVLLTGWGGDEICSYNGRGYLPDLARRGHLLRLHGVLAAEAAAGGRLQSARRYLALLVRRVLIPLGPDWLARIASGRSKDRLSTSLLNPRLERELRTRIRSLKGPDCRERVGVRNVQSRLWDSGHLARRIESWTLLGAARGITYRHPMLERTLVEYFLGIPPELHFEDGRHRALMRQAVDDLFPPSLSRSLTKSEPAATGRLADSLGIAASLLLEHWRPTLEQHPASRFLNIPRLSLRDPQGSKAWLEAVALLRALAYYSIEALGSPSTTEKAPDHARGADRREWQIQ